MRRRAEVAMPADPLSQLARQPKKIGNTAIGNRARARASAAPKRRPLGSPSRVAFAIPAPKHFASLSRETEFYEMTPLLPWPPTTGRLLALTLPFRPPASEQAASSPPHDCLVLRHLRHRHKAEFASETRYVQARCGQRQAVSGQRTTVPLLLSMLPCSHPSPSTAAAVASEIADPNS